MDFDPGPKLTHACLVVDHWVCLEVKDGVEYQCYHFIGYIFCPFPFRSFFIGSSMGMTISSLIMYMVMSLVFM